MTGRGSVQARGNSVRIRISAGRDPVTGKRVVKSITARTSGPAAEDGKLKIPRDLERERVRILRDLDTGTLADPGRLTLADLAHSYLAHARTRTRPRTAQRYAELLNGHVLPRIGGVRLSKLRPLHVQQALDAMLGVGLAPRTVLHAYRVLSAALRYAVRLQILGVNPAAAVSPPRPERTALTIPDPQAVAAILRAAEGTALHAPLVVAAATGMRRGEVLGLNWSSVDLRSGLVRVVRAAQVGAKGAVQFLEPKSDRSRRTVALPPLAVEALRRHRKDQASRHLLAGAAWQALGLVFDRGDGGPIHPDLFSQGFQRLAKRLGVPVRLHDLRHAYATALLVAGVHPKVVSEALGHSSVAFTMDIYSHVLPSMQRAAADAIQAALGPAMLKG
jgi:integrase